MTLTPSNSDATLSREDFSNLIATLHMEGVTEAISRFPEASEFASLLSDLEQLEAERGILHQLTQRAAQRVDAMENAICERMGVDSDG